MEPVLVLLWHQCYEEYGWTIVQENNAPMHKKHSYSYRKLNGTEVLEWQADSPNLNPIETC
jgi:hypothetical protein